MTDWEFGIVKWRLISRHSWPVQMAFVLCTGGVCTGKGRQPFSRQIVSVVGFCRTYSAPFRRTPYTQRCALGWHVTLFAFRFAISLRTANVRFRAYLRKCHLLGVVRWADISCTSNTSYTVFRNKFRKERGNLCRSMKRAFHTFRHFLCNDENKCLKMFVVLIF